MENKEDWEELEKWQREKNEKNIKEYGANLDRPEFKKTRKKITAITKFADKLMWGFCYLLIFLPIGCLIYLIIYIITNSGL